MLLALVLVGLAVAVLSRRLAWVRDRLPVPATTILAWTAAGVVGIALAPVGTGTGRVVLAGVAAAAAGALVIAAAGWVVGAVRPRLARRRARRAGGPTLAERAVRLADRHPGTVRGWGVTAIGVRAVVRAGEVRITGLAAEMTYYALISLVPIATALGASLGYLRPLLGDAQVEEIRTTVVDGLATVFAQQVAGDVLAPLVDGLLDEERGGFALGALVVTLYLASRMFRAAVRALDDAYRVTSRQNVVTQYLLGFGFTIGALVTLVAVLLLVVVGPLLGGGDALAARLGLGDAFRAAWSVLRWPAVLALGGTFLVLLYRYAPNVVSTWRRCLPGAVAGTLGVLLVSAGFVAYVGVAVPETPGADASSAAVVQVAAQMLGLVLAGALWIWLSSIAVLLGGVLNAEVDAARPRARRADPAPARPAGRAA